jgi:hypothetical protein
MANKENPPEVARPAEGLGKPNTLKISQGGFMSKENLPAITTLKQAIDSLREKHPEEIAIIEKAIRKDIVALGTDEAFALRGKQGEIRAFKQSLTLSATNGGLIQPVPGGPFTISAQGYEMWQEATGSSSILPDEVQVDGKWMPNPAPIRDPKNGRLLAIYVRARAFRFSDKGVPMVVDWSTCFDTPSYRLIDLLGKAKKFPQAFCLYPADMDKPGAAGTWAKYPFDESTNLWVNTAHEEALTWYAQILNREKKAMDFAQTFAYRNARKHLSGLQKAPGPQWTFPVLCWRPTGSDWNVAAQYLMPENRNVRLISVVEAATQAQVIEGSENVTDEEGHNELENQTDPEDQTDVIDVEHGSVNDVAAHVLEPVMATMSIKDRQAIESMDPVPGMFPAMSDEDKKIMANYHAIREAFPGEFAAACTKLRWPPEAAHSVPQAIAIIAEINRMLDTDAQEG